MLKCLAEHSSRWTELSIGVTKKMLPVLAELRDRLPALRRVWIQWEQESARRTRIGCFQTAPSLRDITIFNDSPSQVGILLSAQQLTRYDADGPWEMHWTFLTSESAQNLIEVRIETDVPVYSGQGIELLHLQRLFVSRIDVLDNLKAPALEEIAFNLGDGSRAWDRGNLDPFVARSACTLRRLSVRSLQGREVFPILGVLRKYPSITSLAILTPNPNAILPHLTILNPTAGTAVSPQLFEIYIGTPAHMDWVGYIEMLDSRWKVEGCALRSAVMAVIGSPPRSTELSRLGALRKDGLDLTLLKGEDADDAMRAWMYIPKWT
ncbi:hypothetical protein B0H11DRAFT_1154317 [Mycena galericulata]|nr:hypothetical protein B0H11DRAFT_1154317 [Mycena galericulata]